jgi:hypothetical protein
MPQVVAIRGNEVFRDSYSVSDRLQDGLTKYAKSHAEGGKPEE